MVFLAVFPQNCHVEKERSGRLDRVYCKLPDIRREHPRPAKQVSCSKDLYWDRFGKAGLRLERYLAGLDQVESVRKLPFAENRLTHVEVSGHRAICEQCQLCMIHPGQKRMKRYTRAQRFGLYFRTSF